MKKNQIIIAIAVLVIVSSVSFYAGTKMSAGRAPQSGQFGAMNGAGGMMGGRGGKNGAGGMGGFVTGEVISKDATSVTVKLKDGGSKIIFITGGTAVQKMSAGTIDDVAVGSQITANGQSNSDGSINAVSIQQRPSTPAPGVNQGNPAPAVQGK